MVNKVPKLKFYNGDEIPAFGLGTWKSKPGEVAQAVKDAIDIGYRHFDCAALYSNEKEVGDALAEKIAERVIKREDVFITSKVWATCSRPDLVEPALKKTLSELGLEYLDLYLIHFPFGFKDGDSLMPRDENGAVQFSDVDYVDTWKAMEAIHKKGLARNIGVSNFNSHQITRLLACTEVRPVVNQVECHPYLIQKKLSEFCKARDILITAYSPLGSPDSPYRKPGEPLLLDDPKIKDIAEKYNKSPAQVILRYQIQRGHIVIPKSVSKSRLQENFEIFNFELTEADIKQINSFDRNGRTLPLKDIMSHPHYPFNAEF